MRSTVSVARMLSLLLLLMLAGITTYWTTRLLAPAVAVAPSGSIGDDGGNPNLTLAAAVFGIPGASVAAAAPATNVQVVGVAESGLRGVAILSVDGKPASHYGVGAKVDDSTVVDSVGIDTVVLMRRGRRLELKSPDRASIAVLSSGIGQSRNPNRPVPPAAAPPSAPAAPGTLTPGAPAAQPSLPPASSPTNPPAPGQPRPGGSPAAAVAPNSQRSNPAVPADPRAGREPRQATSGVPGLSTAWRGPVAGPNMSAGNPAFQNLR